MQHFLGTLDYTAQGIAVQFNVDMTVLYEGLHFTQLSLDLIEE
jgi:hypothetical protein